MWYKHAILCLWFMNLALVITWAYRVTWWGISPFLTTYCVTLGITCIYFCISGSIKRAQHCGAGDNDYTINDSLYHIVVCLRLRMYRCIFLEGGENLWWIYLWFAIIYHHSSENEICAVVLSTKKLRSDLSLITTQETMDTDWFLYLCFPFLMISSSFIYLYS